MITEKQYWKCIYLWVSYNDYQVVYLSQEQQEVWLANKLKKDVAIFKYGVNTSQETRFLKSRLIEHQEEIENKLGFSPKTYQYYLFTEYELSNDNLNEKRPIDLKFHMIHDEDAMAEHMPNFFTRQINKLNDDKKTTHHYKKRVLNNNPVEKHLLKFAPVTYALIAINVLIWLGMVLFLNHFSDIKLLDVGGLVHFNFVHGEWYRLISSMFLHFGFEHLLMNMLSLFLFGKIVESLIGHWRMLVLYLISGIVGNFASLTFNLSTVSAGASGAIFGLIGAIVTIIFLSKQFNRKAIGELLIALVVLIGLSLFMPNINIVAHVGGFIGGIFTVVIPYFFNKNRNIFWISIIVAALLLILAIVRIYTIDEENIYNTIIKNELYDTEYKEAQDMVDHTINKGYADDETYYLAGMITATKSSKAEAMAQWERGLKNFPNSGLLNYQLAIANRSLADEKKAKKYINKAVEINPNNEAYKNLKNELDDQ